MGLAHGHGWPTDNPQTRGQAESRLLGSLTRSTVVFLTVLCAVALLVPTAVSWSRHAGCSLHAAAQLDADYAQESPDNATLAICAIMKVPSDDPQWLDGRPEDVFEVSKDAAPAMALACHKTTSGLTVLAVVRSHMRALLAALRRAGRGIDVSCACYWGPACR